MVDKKNIKRNRIILQKCENYYASACLWCIKGKILKFANSTNIDCKFGFSAKFIQGFIYLLYKSLIHITSFTTFSTPFCNFIHTSHVTTFPVFTNTICHFPSVSRSKNCGHRIHVLFMMYDVYWYCQMKKNEWLWKFWKRNDLYENFEKRGVVEKRGEEETKFMPHAPVLCGLVFL